MANSITDNRTKLADAANITDGVAGSWTGSTSVVQDTDVYIEGAASIAEQMTNSVRTILWNRGTTINLTNTHIYIWANCGVVGLLATKASGGFAIRFCGPTTSNFFEVYVGGSDSWPNAVAGGWVQFVIDVGAAAASPSNTGGTPPAVSAIQHIGIAALTTTMTKVSDNTWVDAIWSLADGTPGILVQGRNGGTTPWNSADIYTQLGQSAGCFRPGPGGAWVINTPIQFGVNDTTTHDFLDTNAIWLWDNQEYAAADLYGLSALGNSGGTTNVTFGVKTGTGDDATGSQGLTIAAATTGVRWYMDFDDANLDTIGFYGCSLQHGADFQLDASSVQAISCLYIDCTSATISNSLQLRNSVIDANTADATAFMITDDIGDIRLCRFEWSDGHAIQITSNTVSPQTSKGNLFTGFSGTPGTNSTPSSGSTDAAIYNSSGGALTINVTTAGDTPSVRNAASSTTTVNNNINTTLTGLKDNTEVRVYTTGTTTELAGIEDATDGSAGARTFSFSLTAGTGVDIQIFNVDYNPVRLINFVVPSSDSSVPIQQIADRWYTNP